MKKYLSKAVVAALLVGSTMTLSASEDGIMAGMTSLVGIEGGYGNVEYNYSEKLGGLSPYGEMSVSEDAAHGGFKLGAESGAYRVFLSARSYDAAGYDYVRTYGAELQYKFNVSDYFNIFMGANAGQATFKFKDKTMKNFVAGSNYNNIVKVSEFYYGGDAGVNVYVTDSIDLEFGGRFMHISEDKVVQDVTYGFGDIITGYASIIFKFNIDK